MSRQKELAKNTAILTFGKICTQCISFLLLPLYTAALDTSSYGIFDLLTTYATLLLPLVSWQFDQGLFRYMLDYRGDLSKQKRLFSTVFITNIIQSIFFCCLLMIINFIHRIPHIAFLATYVVLQIFVASLMQFIRGLGKNGIYAISSFVSASTTVVLNIFMLIVLKIGLKGLFLATICGQVLTLLYIVFAINPLRYFSVFQYSKQEFNQIKKYSLPLIPNNLAWWIVGLSDRTIISYILGVSLNGIYTVANKFSNVFIQFYNIFNLSWTETVALHYQDADRDEFLSNTMTTLYKLFACACLGIVACMPFVFPILVNEKYSAAYPQIIILMYAMLFRVMVGLYSCVYIATKESKKIAYTSALSAVINISINLLLIRKIGLYAASISTLISFGSMLVLRYIDINKTICMKINPIILYSSLILASVLMVSYYINNTIFNVIMLIVVVIYSFTLNFDLINSGVKLAKCYIKKAQTGN